MPKTRIVKIKPSAPKPRKANTRWIIALKKFNDKRPGPFYIPRRGTADHAKVREMARNL